MLCWRKERALLPLPAGVLCPVRVSGRSRQPPSAPVQSLAAAASAKSSPCGVCTGQRDLCSLARGRYTGFAGGQHGRRWLDGRDGRAGADHPPAPPRSRRAARRRRAPMCPPARPGGRVLRQPGRPGRARRGHVPDGRGRPLVKLNRRIREPSSTDQPSRPPTDGLAYQRIPTHQRPCRSFRCPITWHHIHEPSRSWTSAPLFSGMVEPGTASAGIARSSMGSRRGSDTCVPPACLVGDPAHRQLIPYLFSISAVRLRPGGPSCRCWPASRGM